MYFVPKKEKKVLLVKSAEEVYMADDDNLVVEDEYNDDYVDEYIDDTESSYFTNDLYDVMDDYTYSSRIVRFHSPHRLLSNTLYWDLKYNCGIYDWLVYDDGYSVYVYPTANNIYYNYPYYYNWTNRWNWSTYHNWGYPYYGHHDWWYHNNYHWHTPHWHSHHTPSRPSYNSDRIPTNAHLATPRVVAR